MFLGKSKQIKVSPKKSRLDQVLWFVENYLPQKNRTNRDKLRLDSLEAETINQIQKFASIRSKSIIPMAKDTQVSFTFGSWALPYLKFLKQIGLTK